MDKAARIKQAGADDRDTVFVVADDESVRRALTRLIKAVGYILRPFASARDFLEYWRVSAQGASCLVLDQ